MKIAIIIGHTWRASGAYSKALKENEYPFNERLAAQMFEFISANNLAIFRRDGGGVPQAYYLARAWGQRPGEDFRTVELHFNAGVPEATGSEVIYTRPESKSLAVAIQSEVVAALGLPDRGAKLPYQHRGEESLNALPGVPSVIVEPFFGTNDQDCFVATGRLRPLAKAIIRGAQAKL